MDNDMNIKRLSYRELEVFDSIFRHLHSGMAANELGVSNTTISRHLATLRNSFQDVLFIRRAHGFVATDKATELSPLIKQLLVDYNRLTKEHTTFDPSGAKEHFVIYAFNEFTYATNKIVIEKISPQAPQLSFEVRTLSTDCRRDIENGEIDFAVVYENFVGSKLACDLISPTEDMYLIAGCEHEIFKREVDFEQLFRYPYFELDNFEDIYCPLISLAANKRNSKLDVIGYVDNLSALSRHLQDYKAFSLSCNVFSVEFLRMIKNLRVQRLPKNISKALLSEVKAEKAVGNYLVYSNMNQSACHSWVKEQLLKGLQDAWKQAGDSCQIEPIGNI